MLNRTGVAPRTAGRHAPPTASAFACRLGCDSPLQCGAIGISWERGRPARMLLLITWERGRPARMLLLMVVAELPRGFAGSHYVGSNRNGQAEGEPGRRCRSIQVEEMPEAVPVIVRAGRPRSQEMPPTTH